MKHFQISNLKLVSEKCLEETETNMAGVLSFISTKAFLVKLNVERGSFQREDRVWGVHKKPPTL